MKKRLLSLLLVLALLASLLPSVTATAFAANAQTGQSVVTFTSDVHHTSTSDTTAANRLKLWLEAVADQYGTVDVLGVCGDLGVYSVYNDTYWSYAQRVMDNVAALGIEGIYTTGNHEHENGNYSTTTNATAKEYIRLGVGKSAENYEIYCMGAASKTMEFPESDIEALSDYLESVGTEKPVFILSHYPLHLFSYTESGRTKTRDAGNREKVIELLNGYPNAYFIWGHNHSHGDPNYDMIETEKIGDTEINFVYAAAGAMTDKAENTYAGDVTGKGLVALISPDGKTVSLRYVDEDYQPFAEWSNKEIIKYAVSFDANGGSGTMKTASVIAAEDGTCCYAAPACTFAAPEGMHFAGWAQSPEGEMQSSFDLSGNTTLYAVWAEGIELADVTMFACANPEADLYEDVPITFTPDGSGYTGTLLLEDEVDISQIRLSWPKGMSVSEYAKGEAPIAADGESLDYTVTAADGTAVFTVQTVCETTCIIDKDVSLQEGALTFILNGTDMGIFTFAKSGSGWTIKDSDGKYLTISSKALKRSSTAFVWTYSGSKFSASVKTSSYRSYTYYLVLSSGSLSVSTSNKNNTAAFRIHQESKHHTYTAVVTAATCAAGGYTTYTCECGASYIGSRTQPLAHTYTAVVTKPTCTAGGYTTYTCICGDSYIADETAPIAHSYTAVVTKPTCTAGGYTTYTCVCGDSYIADETAPIAHSYTAVVTKPTCTAGGYTTYTCVCGDSYIADETAPIAHSYTAVVTKPTCTAGGYTTYTCICGDSYIADETAPIAHSYTAVVTKPTCTAGGYTTYTCVCGDSYVADQTEATGHSHKAVITAPTCTAEGYTTYTCVCGDSYIADKTEKLAHSYANGVCTGCGQKDPNYGPVCEGDTDASLQAGELTLILNGTDMGVFTFAKSGSGWTIMDSDGKYLTISSKALARSSTAFVWTYSGSKFSASVKTSSYRSSTYYLVVSSGKLAVSTSNKNNTAAFRMHIERDSHSFGAWSCTNNETHSRTCTLCGETETAACTYGTDHVCTVCGATDPAYCSVTASVTVTSTTSTSWWSKKTTYTATITTTATGTTVAKVEYSTDNSSWKTGTSYSASSQINTLYVRVTDAQGRVYRFVYSGGETNPA